MISIFKDENNYDNYCGNNCNTGISNGSKNDSNSVNNHKLKDSNVMQQNSQNIDYFNSGLPMMSNVVLNFCDSHFPFDSKIINFSREFNIDLKEMIKKILVNEMVENNKNNESKNIEIGKFVKNNLVEYFYGNCKNEKYSKFEMKERENSREKLNYLVEKESEEIRKNYLLVRHYCAWKGVYSKINIPDSAFEELNKVYRVAKLSDCGDKRNQNVCEENVAAEDASYVKISDKKNGIDDNMKNNDGDQTKDDTVTRNDGNCGNDYGEGDENTNIKNMGNAHNAEKNNFIVDKFNSNSVNEKGNENENDNGGRDGDGDGEGEGGKQCDKMYRDKMHTIHHVKENGNAAIRDYALGNELDGDCELSQKLDGDHPYPIDDIDFTDSREIPLITRNDDIENVSESENEIEFEFIETCGKYGEKRKDFNKTEFENGTHRFNTFENSSYFDQPQIRNNEYESTDFTDHDYRGKSVKNDNGNFAPTKSGNKEEYEKLFTEYNYPNISINLGAKKEKEITIDNLLNESRYNKFASFPLVFKILCTNYLICTYNPFSHFSTSFIYSN